MKRSDKKYVSYNSKFKDKFDIEFIPGESVNQKTNLDKWLTERYALFQDSDNSINEFEIHHFELSAAVDYSQGHCCWEPAG